MATPRIEDLWEKDAYSDRGRRLGRIEAVGMGRDRVPRRVGVRSSNSGRALTFYSLTGATIAGDRVVIATGQRLRVVSGGSG